MSQINLLKQSSSTINSWQTVPKVLIRVFLVVFAALIAFYIWLTFKSNSVSKAVVNLKTTIGTEMQTALSTPGRDELLTRQLQIKNLNDLISSHVYWSQIMPKIAAATYKKATYSSLRVGLDGSLVLSVNVPSLEDMDKYLQVFNLPEVYKYFYNVKISSYRKVVDKTSNSVSFDVTMQFDPSIIQFTDSKTAN